MYFLISFQDYDVWYLTQVLVNNSNLYPDWEVLFDRKATWGLS